MLQKRNSILRIAGICTVVFGALLLTGFASKRAGESHPDSSTPVPASTSVSTTPSPSPTVSLPQGAGNITFKCLNCTDREKEIIRKTQIIAKKVIASQCFADHFILDKYRSQLIQTNGLSREEVVKKIQNAVVEVPLSMYYDSRSGVYGYTYEGRPTVYLNRWYRTEEDYKNGDWSICAEASNEIHESTHKMGFDHDFKSTSRRPYSVPYTANFATDSCCPAIFANEKF